MRKTIDSHTHLYNVFDSKGRIFYQSLDEMQKNHSVSAFNIASIPTHSKRGVDQNILSALYKLHSSNCYAYGGLFYPTAPARFPLPPGMDAKTQYTELMKIGFDGIKMLELKPAEQKVYKILITNPFFDDLFKLCEKSATPMLWHVADPDTFWDIDRIPERFIERGWYYGDGTYLSLEEIYSQVHTILAKYPNLNITFAHFLFYSETPKKLEELFNKYQNIKVDLAPGSEMFAAFDKNLEFYKEFFQKYSDRIMFGTDVSLAENTASDYQRYKSISDNVYSFLTSDRTITIYGISSRGLSLDEASLDNILWKNFEKSAGSTPKPINVTALKAYIAKYYEYISDKKLKKLCDEFLA